MLERARAAGLNVRANVDAELDDTGLRIVQEALTNALKHAPGADVEVEAGEREIVVRDHGGVAPSTLAETGSGLGLTGLRERVEAAGGTLVAGPARDGGWEVRATYPRGGTRRSPSGATTGVRGGG
jgi:signal transduction histidine kinase